MLARFNRSSTSRPLTCSTPRRHPHNVGPHGAAPASAQAETKPFDILYNLSGYLHSVTNLLALITTCRSLHAACSTPPPHQVEIVPHGLCSGSDKGPDAEMSKISSCVFAHGKMKLNGSFSLLDRPRLPNSASVRYTY